MARAINQLDARKLPTTRGYHHDGAGLYLRVGPTGARSWTFRYRVGEKLREMGLGSLNTINLADAREAALDCRKDLLTFRHGKADDPLTIRQAARAARKVAAVKAITFKQCAERYIDSKSEGWRNPRNRQQWNASLTRYAYPVIGALPVQAVDLTLVLRVLEPIWKETPETASRVRQRIEAVLDAATARKEREGDNPARRDLIEQAGLAKKSKLAPVEHHAAMAYHEIGSFVAALRQQDGVAARALEFAVLTAARSNEVLGARWSEIDMGERVWIVPGARMKGGKEHRVPLSDAAMAILAELIGGDHPPPKESDGLVFPGATGTKLGHDAMIRQLKRMGRSEVVHGFRSSFAVWAAERTSYPYEIRELALAHTVGTAVERSYQRSDLFERRRRLMGDWAAYVDRVEGAAGDVVPIRA